MILSFASHRLSGLERCACIRKARAHCLGFPALPCAVYLFPNQEWNSCFYFRGHWKRSAFFNTKPQHCLLLNIVVFYVVFLWAFVRWVQRDVYHALILHRYRPASTTKQGGLQDRILFMNDTERVGIKIRSEVAAERKTTSALNGQIKTAYLKNQLQRASHSLDDAETALRHALQANPTDKGMWINLAQFNLQMATQFREKVQEYFDKYGPNIQEIGGGSAYH
jgi:hypothetical protein